MQKLGGKTAIVTGAAQDLGAVYFDALSRACANIATTDVAPQSVSPATAQLHARRMLDGAINRARRQPGR